MLKVDNVTHWSIPVNNLEEQGHSVFGKGLQIKLKTS